MPAAAIEAGHRLGGGGAVVGERGAGALLQHQDPEPALGEGETGDRPTGARADHNHVPAHGRTCCSRDWAVGLPSSNAATAGWS